ncbi:MAG: hypothetical protein PF487_08245 [Bacteroidales bacterium]|jgi:hypothetical protein|nr:hypothetical protein [Bacteroidales bacterium]
MTKNILLLFSIFFILSTNLNAQYIFPVGEYAKSGKVEFSNIELKDNNLYFPLGKTGLHILDISEPNNIKEISLYKEFEWREKKKVYGTAYCVNIKGDTLFLAYGDLGLKILCISDPTMPYVLGTYYRYQEVYTSAVYENYAFLGLKNMGLEIVDFQNTDDIKMVSRNNVKDFPVQNLQIKPPFVVMTGGIRGMKAYQFVDPFTKFKVQGFPRDYSTNSEAYKLIIKDNIGYLANDHEGLTILSLALPLYPVKISNIKTKGNAKDVCLDKNFAYVTSGKTIEVFDVSDKDNPVKIFEHKEKKKRFKNIVIDGNYLYASYKQFFRKYGIMIFQIE